MNHDKIINPDVSINDIKDYFRQHNSGPFFSMFETGLDELRFDLIRIDPYRQYIRIFEFKSCRNDFTSDKKWQKYLSYCHTFTFTCPRQVIVPQDLPPGIGLLWIYKWRWKDCLWKPDRWVLDGEWQKRPRGKEVDKDTMLRIAFMLLHRVRWRSNAVF